MATFTFFDEFKKFLGDGTIDLDTHTFKAVLSNVAPVAGTNTLLADITQIAATNGYTTGGVALTGVTWLESGAGTGIWIWSSADFSWTASGGSMPVFQYVSIYDDTAAGDPLVGFLNYGAALTVTNGNTFLVDVGASGIFDLT